VSSKKKSLGIRLNGPLIGIISRIEKVKGITFILQALPQIVRIYPDLTLLIVGDGSEKALLQNETEELGVMKHVIFTGSRFDIPEILQLLDIYLLPSLSEGLPLGLLEAMASGCPIVASDVGGIPSVVDHGHSALLIPPGLPDALALAVIRLLENSDLREKLSKNAKIIFHNNYDSSQMTNKYCELYVQ
jgi:glycosyltransferase involved in cell wall biosynthesis